MKQMIRNFFRKKKPEDFKEKIYRMKVNKISRDVFIKKDRIEFVLKSEGEFDFFTKILLQAQENDRSISFSIGPQDGIQTVTIFLPKEKLNGIEQ
jgi:5-formaminoimidazole-4-carboxamide-1-beta-D-ribofuranosyl 5'-monophosphate synthetase